MKNKFKKSGFLLSSLMMLSVGAGIISGVDSHVDTVEAAETNYSLTISPTDFSGASYAANNSDHSFKSSSENYDYTFTTYQCMQSNSSIQMQKSKGYLYNKTELNGYISSIEIDVKQNECSIYTASSQLSTSHSTATGTLAENIYKPNGNDHKFLLIKASTKGATQLKSIKINYVVNTGDTGGETPDPDTPEITEATITFDSGEYGETTVTTVNTTDLKYTLPEVTITNDQYEFVGWYNVDEKVGDAGDIVEFEAGSTVTLTAKYDLIEVEEPEGQVVDIINSTFTGTSTSYVDWDKESTTSNAKYKGLSLNNSDYIQINSKNNYGIVTTNSGGVAKKVAVTWNSKTSSGKTLDVYGKDTSYSATSDLYDTSTQGTLIGTIVCGTSTELVIDGEYSFIGMRSNSGAMYLSEIKITWDSESSGDTPMDGFNITFDAGTKGTASESSITTSGEFTFPSVTVNSAYYTFKGWYLESEEETLYTAGNSYTAASDLTFIAKYETVTPKSYVYELVTDASTLVAGDKVIIAANVDNNALSTNQKSSNRGATEINRIDNMLSVNFIDNDIEILTLEAGTVDGTFAFNTGEGYLYAASSSGNQLKTKSTLDDNGSWKIEISESETSIIAQGTNERNIMKYNPNNDSPLFACYATINETYQSVEIYKVSEKSLSINFMYNDDENPEAIRFISTIAGFDTSEIESVQYSFVKNGETATPEAEKYIYESISGSDVFVEKSNTYYAVYAIRGVQGVLNQSFNATITVTLTNGLVLSVTSTTFNLGSY